MQKALCIIQAHSIDHLQTLLQVVSRNSSRTLKAYLAIIVPNCLLYVVLSCISTLPPQQEALSAYLVLSFYILNMLMVAFDLLFAIFSFKVISAFVLAMSIGKLSSFCVKAGVGIIIFEVLIGKTL
mmetsp:Transcript_33119/g.50777  ORF Transcript_33119/g.50777 Transcript_33119/m.50777 type:complete len:126 (-) Transcript_33119:662-1039(-)